MNSVKDLIREKIRIEEVIGSYITLLPIGKNYKACCPFHVEKTPSFQVNPEKQMFYCFGCKKGGDIFSFIQEIERVDFKESLRMLADRAGIDIQQSADFTKEMKQKKQLIEIHELATRFFQLCLSKNTEAIDYLEKRGLHRETLKHWRIGYAPDDFSALAHTLSQKSFTSDDLIASGLIGSSARGLYDRFRGRIMFPITDQQGVVIGFSGRLLPGTREAGRTDVGKYINSPETILYHKSRALFGFALAKKTITEKKRAIVVEGQMDVILSHQIGYTETVALSGTAATDTHMEILSRFADQIIIATDGDQAGIVSAHKIALLAYRFDREVSLVMIPIKSDPAEIIQKNKNDWDTLVENRVDYIDFHGSTIAQQTLREKIISTEQYLFPIVAEISHHVKRDVLLQKIALQLGVSLESIHAEFVKYQQRSQQSFFGNNNLIGQEISEQKDYDNFRYEKELYVIEKLFPTETKEWFDNHVVVLQENQGIKECSGDEFDDIAKQYHVHHFGQTYNWQAKLDSIIQRIILKNINQSIHDIKKQLGSLTENQEIYELQKQLLELQSKKEVIIQHLAE